METLAKDLKLAVFFSDYLLVKYYCQINSINSQ